MFNRVVHPGRKTFPANSGFTLVEFMITSAISTLVLASLMAVMLFSLKNFVAIGNYGDLNQRSRYALDVMNRDIQNAAKLNDGSAYSITMSNNDGDRFSYIYDPASTTFTRYFTNSAGNITVNVLLTNCDAFSFNFYLRVPTNSMPTNASGPFFVSATNSSISETKIISVDWKCSRTIQGTKANTESVQTAQIAIRN